MKRLVLLVFAFLPLVVVAQTKKVAVMETTRMTDDVSVMQSQMVRGGLETAVANAPGYEGYDRSSFDAIMREQNFQRSGAVSDAQIRKLGEMAGVQYIIVSEASSEGGYFYVLVKMLDVETGKYGAAYDKLCSTSAVEIKKACTELGAKLFGTSEASSYRPTGGNIKEEKTFAGIIKYAITYKDLDPQYNEQLPTEMMVYVKGGKYRMDQVSPMYTMGAVFLEDGSSIVLLDVMGQKIATRQSKEEIEKAKTESKAQFVEKTNVTKAIAGYKCTKYNVTTDGENMEVFVTEDIPMPEKYYDNSQFNGIRAVPMQYTMSTQGMNMTMTVKEVRKGSVTESMFMIPDDYYTVSPEEFAKMLGGGE